MIDFTKQILTSQLEASLAMLAQCIERCPAEHWNGKIAKYEFWHVAYHTLYCTDMYLSTGWDAYEQCEFLPAGKEEVKLEYPTREMTKAELLAYADRCRNRAIEAIANETPESLEQPVSFPWLPSPSRGELYLYNLRHIMHHTGQLTAYLRRVGVDTDWVRSGWRVSVKTN